MLLPERFRDRHPALVESFRASGETARRMGSRSEIHGRRKDGSTFPLELGISEMAVDGERLYCGIVRDMKATPKSTSSKKPSSRFCR